MGIFNRNNINKTHRIILKSFIAGLKKGKQKNKIALELSNEGYSKETINYVYHNLLQDKFKPEYKLVQMLVKYIQEQLTAGYTIEAIKDHLMKNGYQEEHITQAIHNISLYPEGKTAIAANYSEKAKTNFNETKPEQVGISKKLDSITEKLELMTPAAKLKQKQFALPWSVRSKLNALAKKSSVLIILLKTNRSIEPKIAKIQNGLIEIEGRYHNCSTDFVYLWQGRTPTIVLPEWSLNPVGTHDYYDAINDGQKVDAQEVIIRALEAKENMQNKKELPKGLLIGILIVAIIGGYLIFGKK